MKMNPSPFLSATFEECVACGKDVYEGGVKYNNSSIVIFALADAVDSLTVIKKRSIFDKGGMAVQFNVLSVEKLRLAQEHPEEYQTLQVRLCG